MKFKKVVSAIDVIKQQHKKINSTDVKIVPAGKEVWMETEDNIMYCLNILDNGRSNLYVRFIENGSHVCDGGGWDTVSDLEKLVASVVADARERQAS